MKRYAILFWTVWMLPAAPAAATPDTTAQARGGEWRLRSALRGRINRSGVGTKTDLSYRVPLGHHDHLLLRGIHAEAGGFVSLSPASVDPAVFFRVVPIAPLLLGVSAQQLRWFGTFGNLSDFEGHRPDWSPRVLRDRTWKKNPGQYGTGYRFTAQAMLRLKLGPLLGLFDTQYKWIGADIPPGNSFCPADEDLLVARRDRILTLKGDFLYIIHGRPSGATLTMAGAHWERHRTRQTGVDRQLLGGIAAWRTPWRGPWVVTLASIIALYIDDPYRVGEPYVGLSMSLERAWRDD